MSIDFSLLRYATSQLDAWTYSVWVILILLSVALMVILRQQNRYYAQLCQEHGNLPITKATLELSRVRGYVALWIWILFVGLFITRDIERKMEAAPNHPEAGYTIAPDDDIPTDFTQEKPTVAPVKPPERHIDEIKSSYEDALVSYMILSHCDPRMQAYYQPLYDALTRALAPYDATGLAVRNVVTAATGTYQALYSQTPCTDTHLAKTRRSFLQFIQQIESPE
jgi:hypothetical protein